MMTHSEGVLFPLPLFLYSVAHFSLQHGKKQALFYCYREYKDAIEGEKLENHNDWLTHREILSRARSLLQIKRIAFFPIMVFHIRNRTTGACRIAFLQAGCNKSQKQELQVKFSERRKLIS